MSENDFTTLLEEWYSRYGRTDLPWRGIDDPYLIWVSEIILQQTRVAQGRDYYLRFINRFPDFQSLADAGEDEVLKLWQGLGYYSRARNMHAAAKAMAAAGCFPSTYEGIRALKGIGDYTAAAIASFVYRLPHAVVDGNVYRVLSRVFGIDSPIDSNQGKKKFTALAERLLDRERPDIWNSAIMDFGAVQCTPKSPACLYCPFAASCRAFLTGKTEELPVKSKKTAVKERYLVYIYIEDATSLLLRKRPEGDIWQGLYEPYLIEFGTAPSEGEVAEHLASLACRNSMDFAPESLVPVAKGLKHVLTHRKLWVSCYRWKTVEVPDIQDYMKVPKALRDSYASPRIVGTLYGLIDASGGDAICGICRKKESR